MIDDRNLVDGMYQSGHDRQSNQSQAYQLPPHRSPLHHPPPRYSLQHPQCNEIFYEEELHNSIYQCNELKEDYEDEGMTYGRRRMCVNPNPNRRDRFLNPNRRDIFSNSIHDKGRGNLNSDEFRILSFDENLDIESSLL